MRADVNAMMAGELGKWLAEQRVMREEAQQKANWRWVIGACVLLPVAAFVWFLPFDIIDLKIAGMFIGLFGVGAWGYAPIAEAKKAIKVGINSAIAADLGLTYNHDVTPGDEYQMACTYGLLPSSQRESFEDLWYGDLEGHSFQLYEAHLEVQRGSGKNRRWVTVFRGAIIQMTFGRSFHSTTLLQRKGKHKKFWFFGGAADKVKFKGHQLDLVDQVHPDFEDVFEVYSDDQVEARVLIHPSYIEHLLNLERAFKGDAVRALFARGEVIVAVESGNLFESGSMKSEEDHARAEEAAEQFSALAALAMAINQNERGRVMGDGEARPAPAQAPSPSPAPGSFGRKGL